MPDESHYTDAQLRTILERTRTIALVGASANPVKASHFVLRYFALRGFRVIPVNPAHRGKRIMGEPVRGAISELDIQDGIDMIDIFRPSAEVPGIVDMALARLLPGLRTIWMQQGIVHHDRAWHARAAGLDVIMDRCPKIEHQRLAGDLRKSGIRTGIISSRLPDRTD